MRNSFLLLLLALFCHQNGFGQCPSQSFSGIFIPTNGQFLSGTYDIAGVFWLPAGDTVWVTSFVTNTCGELVINADSVRIEGVIMAMGAGLPGGNGGLGGSCADSIRFQDCTLATQCLAITNVLGGLGGFTGTGTGTGNGGSIGTFGKGRKNSCNTTSDRVGRVGGGGGAGSGSGGSYGGLGNTSGNGGAATVPIASANSPDNPCPPANATSITAGLGGAGASAIGLIYGTISGTDADLGSGGGGGGGGGRGFFPAENGGKGGNGGGVIKINTTYGLYISGVLNANGENGQKGGNGGNSGESPRCCIDLCPQVNEHTYVGAGGGGGGAGGGSGGCISLSSLGSMTLNGVLLAEGGTGGAGGSGGATGSWSYQEPGGFICGTATGIFTSMTANAADNGAVGGNGGGGRIKLFYDQCGINTPNPVYSVAGGGTGATDGSFFISSPTATPPQGSISQLNNPQNYCAGAIGDTIFATTPASPYYLPLYEWYYQTDCNGIWNNTGTNAPFLVSNFSDTACVLLSVTYGACTTFYQDTLTVQVSQPSLVVNVLNPTPTICANQTASLSLSTVLPVGSTIQWYHNNIAIPLANGGNATPLNNLSTAGSYYATIQIPNSICPIQTDTVNLTVNALPIANLITPNNQTIFCEGSNGLTITALPNTGVSYQWFWNNNPILNNNATLNATDSGTYTVVVTNPVVCSDTAQVALSIYPKPSVSIAATSFYPNQLFSFPNFCAGDTVLLTANNAGTTLYWYYNNLYLPNSANQISIPATMGGASYSVILTEGPNCSDTAFIDLNPIAVPVVNVAASSANFCLGDSVLLTASGATTYQWIGSNTTQPNLYVNQGGSFCVVGYEPVLGCSDTACSPNLSVFQQANALFTVDDTTVCQGDTAYFVANGGSNFQWLFNGNPIVGATTDTLFAQIQGNYSVVASYTATCLDTSDVQFLQILPNPIANISTSTPNPTCIGDTIFLTGNGGVNYTWLTPLGTTTGQQYPATVAGDYQVVVTDNMGCQDSSTLLAINFFALPSPVINLQAGNNPTCNGVNIILATTQPFSSYQWLLNGQPLAGETNPTLTTSIAGNYTIAVTDANGCQAISATFLLQNSTNLPAQLVGDTSICAGQTVTWSVQPNTFTTYQWLNQNGTQPIVGATNSTYSPNQPDGYAVIITQNGCIDTTQLLHLTLLPSPIVSLSSVVDSLGLCLGKTDTLTANGATTYKWYRNNTLVGNSNPLIVQNLGNYWVIGTNTEGCKDTSAQIKVYRLPSPKAKALTPDGTTFCKGDSVRLVLGDITGTWQAWKYNHVVLPLVSPNFYANLNGVYTLVVGNSCGEDSVNILLSEATIQADFSFMPNQELFVETVITFINESQPTPAYQVWIFGDNQASNQSNPHHSYLTAGNYEITLMVANPEGCKDTLTQNLTIYDKGSIYFPTVFTPNGDGNNDIFQIKGTEITALSLLIFDRWGKEIHHFVSPQDFWDGTHKGKDVPEGVYIYQYQYTLRNGSNHKGAGSITLIR